MTSIELFMDFHCPYSYRATAWLDGLDPDRVVVRHRLFGLEQINRDASASDWRLWEQPLDYLHYRERQDRRPLAAFLAMAIFEATETAEVAGRFRLGVYAARFEQAADISDLEVLEAISVAVGMARGELRGRLDDPSLDRAARGRIADDWAAGRAEFAVFGVPTLRIAGGVPFYLRLAGPVAADAGAGFLDALLAFRDAAPDVVELKQPEAVEAADRA